MGAKNQGASVPSCPRSHLGHCPSLPAPGIPPAQFSVPDLTWAWGRCLPGDSLQTHGPLLPRKGQRIPSASFLILSLSSSVG